jgi:ATP-dependent Lon protease
MDDLDQKLVSLFPGKIVRKDLVLPLKGQLNVPTYVLEYLLGKYCSSSNTEVIDAGLRKVHEILTDNYVRPDQSELEKAKIKEFGRHKIIDKVKVKLVETDDKYWAELSNLQLDNINISDYLVNKYEKLLTGGIWAMVEIEYNRGLTHRGVNRPFNIIDLRPIQLAISTLGEVQEKRHFFTRDEWLDAVLRSIGIEPSNNELTHRIKMLLLARLIPLCENNFNFVELGPRGTGKSYVYREISPFSILISGGKTTVASLFVNIGTRKIGMVGLWDVIGFDEVAGMAFRDTSAIQILKDYMELGSFSRGREEIHAMASMVFNGNIDDVERALETSHLFITFPPEMQDTALLDRLHLFLPGWEVPKMKDEYFTQNYGFVVNYVSELLRELRSVTFAGTLDTYFDLGSHLNTRDARAVRKIVSGFIKLLHPDGGVSKEEVEEYLILGLEMRRRVKEQLRKIGGKEFWEVNFSYVDKDTNIEVDVDAPEIAKFRNRRIDLAEPRVGRIYGLAATGFGGSLLVLEVAAMRGSGRLKMTGGLRKTIKESIVTAYDYLRANYEKYGIAKDYFNAHDIHFQAVELAVPKEGPSAGITSATVLLSTATNRKIRSDMAMTGELTIHGEVYPVGAIDEKVTAAYENGIKLIVVSERNKKDVETLSEEIREKMQFVFAKDIDDVFDVAFT